MAAGKVLEYDVKRIGRELLKKPLRVYRSESDVIILKRPGRWPESVRVARGIVDELVTRGWAWVNDQGYYEPTPLCVEQLKDH